MVWKKQAPAKERIQNMEMKKNFVINTAFYAIIAALFLAAWRYLVPAMTPFIIGFIIASVVQFPLNRLGLRKDHHKKYAVVALCLIFYALLVFLMIFLSVKLVSEISDFAATVPDLIYHHFYPFIYDVGDQIQALLEPIDMNLAQVVNELGKSLASSLAKYATELSGWAVRTVASGAISIPGLLIQVIITVVSSFYIALDYPSVLNFLKRLIPAKQRDYVVQAVGYARTVVLAYIKSYSIMFCVTFVELWLGLWILKVPYTLILAFAIAVFDLMPILGVGGILLPWSAIALIMGNLPMGIGMLLLYLVIAAVRNTLEPRIVGKHIGLHPLATLIAMVVGLKLAGLVGMMLLPISLVSLVRLKANSPKKEENDASES